MEPAVKQPEIRFYETAEDASVGFSVIVARHEGQWVFCRHRERSTWECPGGHREKGETPEETAARELFEETGAEEYELRFLGYYAVVSRDGESLGALYTAEIRRFAPLPSGFEIAEINITPDLPGNWTYPDIQPKLLAYAQRRLAES